MKNDAHIRLVGKAQETRDLLQLSQEPTETLMERLRAIKEERYPTMSHQEKILRILSERVPPGCFIVYDEEQLKSHD